MTKLRKKVFKIKNCIDPFSLLIQFDKDSFYSFCSEQYYKQFNIHVNILSMDLDFIANGVKVTILEYDFN